MNVYKSIAIDGPSGAGKTTLAKKIASKYGFIYVDTGAIYRTLGLAAYKNGIDCKNEEDVSILLPNVVVEMKYNELKEQRMYLGGADVSDQIRLPEISICASDISSLPKVRAFLLQMQRDIALNNSVIMDGRDIGTVVLPNADLKIFLTASTEARSKRRYLELVGRGIECTYEEVAKDIIYRDEQDSNRDVAPLKKAEDAIEVDTSELTFEQSFNLVCSIVDEKLFYNKEF